MRALLVLLAAPAIACAQDSWTGPDKPKHFAVSFALGVVASNLTPDPWKAVGIAMVPGVIKEISDKGEGGKFSAKDLVWDFAGAYLGVHTGRWLITKTGKQTTVYFRSEF